MDMHISSLCRWTSTCLV